MSNAITGQTLDSDQLDLFVHSHAVILANEAIDALLARKAGRAAACLDRLRAEEPGYEALTALETLWRTLSEWPLRSTNASEVAGAVERLQREVHPAALAALGSKAADFMRPLWRDLAHAAHPHVYDAALPQAFCAGLYLRCGDAPAAARAAGSIPDWQRNADALRWLAVARYDKAELNACLPPLMRLALWSPQHLSATLVEIDDSLLQRDWRAFHVACHWLDFEDETAEAWFPAWYQVEHPGIRIGSDDATSLPATQAAQTFFAIARLLELEKRGYSTALVSARGRLRNLAPEMFAFYMARREVDHR